MYRINECANVQDLCLREKRLRKHEEHNPIFSSLTTVKLTGNFLCLLGMEDSWAKINLIINHQFSFSMGLFILYVLVFFFFECMHMHQIHQIP